MLDVVSVIFLTALAVINASIPEQQIPIDVQITPVLPQGEEAVVSGGSEAATADAPAAASPVPLIDTAMLTGLVATAGGLFAAWKQGQKKDQLNDAKVDAVADSAINIKESLKGTDKGAADTAAIVAQVVAQLKQKDDLAPLLVNCEPAARQNAQEWKQDVKEYYENKSPTTSQDVGLDKTRAKLVDVNKETKPTSS